MVLHHIDQDDQVTPGEVDISGPGFAPPLRLTEERWLSSEALFSGLDRLLLWIRCKVVKYSALREPCSAFHCTFSFVF